MTFCLCLANNFIIHLFCFLSFKCFSLTIIKTYLSLSLYLSLFTCLGLKPTVGKEDLLRFFRVYSTNTNLLISSFLFSWWFISLDFFPYDCYCCKKVTQALLIESSLTLFFFIHLLHCWLDSLNQVYAKVNRTIVALEYFTTNEWTFVNKNQLSLCDAFPNEDVDKFFCDVRRIHWPTYMETYILGVRKFLLKEDPSTLPLARIKLRRWVDSLVVKNNLVMAVILYPLFRDFLL